MVEKTHKKEYYKLIVDLYKAYLKIPKTTPKYTCTKYTIAKFFGCQATKVYKQYFKIECWNGRQLRVTLVRIREETLK